MLPTFSAVKWLAYTMYHEFHLVNLKDFGYNEWLNGHDLTGGVSIHDDHLGYMKDTLNWIETYNPAGGQPCVGLCWFGPTVIRIEGANQTIQVFQAWANLFALGPETLELIGSFGWDDEHPDGYYERLYIPRDEIVSKLRTIASYAQKIIESNGEYFVLHMGL